jgi:PKD repeat protein
MSVQIEKNTSSLVIFLFIIFSLLMLQARIVVADVILSPTTYSMASLQTGGRYYTDRTYTLTSIPSEIATGVEKWIRTANNDKNITTVPFLRFTVDQDSKVFVAYDSRATSLPDWLREGFSLTALTIGVSEEMGFFKVYEKGFSPGIVSLGGNKATGAVNVSSNYIVIIQPISATPAADFTGTPLSGYAPLMITFSDRSAGSVTSWAWDFNNDGIADSTIQNPIYNYATAGTYSVRLTVTGSGGTNSILKTNYITVNDIPSQNVTIISPLNYQVKSLHTGNTYYTDRTYTLTSIPSEIATGDEKWIKTANNDKNITTVPFLRFTVEQSSKVFVAYDSRATSLPDWLRVGFNATSLTIGVSEEMGFFKVYEKNFSQGAVSLGGNKATGAANVSSNYIVIVKPILAEICNNELDDDGDGLIDCLDTDCTGSPECAGTIEQLFYDDFSDGVADGWTIVNDGNSSSSWSVVNGEYYQRNFTSGMTESYHRGTFSYLNKWFSLTNFRIKARLKAPIDSYGEDIGIMFRYQDINNYYRMSINSQFGYTRLEKKVNGIFTTLAVNALGFEKEQWIEVLIEVFGDKIFIYRDQDKLISVADAGLSSGTVALYCERYALFDDITIETNNPEPEIIISQPLAYTVETTTMLNVSSVVMNFPIGGSVKFQLDGAIEVVGTETQPGVFTGQFSTLSTGEHFLDAILMNDQEIEIARDTNTIVGVNGDTYITVGDSLTNGTGDNYSADNVSQDGRIKGFLGYQALLSDLCTDRFSYPNIIYNEGVGGDETIDTLGRIDSIISRHPGSNMVNLLLGTNDSGSIIPVPSGIGCSGGDCDGTYKGNLQEIVNKIFTAPSVEFVSVASVPPVFAACATCRPYSNPDIENRNLLIKEYNDVIQSELNGISVGPDFYSFFLDKFSLIRENIHPNALGYVIMSHLWFDPSGNTLPFFLTNLKPSQPSSYPSTYKQNLIDVGDKYYIDREYTITSIPDELIGGIWIMTANNDKLITKTDHISFDLDRPSIVYIAYDNRATSLPTWMNGFLDTGLTIGTNDTALKVYSKNYIAGAVLLGGNSAPGAVGVESHYIAIVKEE